MNAFQLEVLAWFSICWCFASLQEWEFPCETILCEDVIFCRIHTLHHFLHNAVDSSPSYNSHWRHSHEWRNVKTTSHKDHKNRLIIVMRLCPTFWMSRHRFVVGLTGFIWWSLWLITITLTGIYKYFVLFFLSQDDQSHLLICITMWRLKVK